MFSILEEVRVRSRKTPKQRPDPSSARFGLGLGPKRERFSKKDFNRKIFIGGERALDPLQPLDLFTWSASGS